MSQRQKNALDFSLHILRGKIVLKGNVENLRQIKAAMSAIINATKVVYHKIFHMALGFTESVMLDKHFLLG